MSADPLPPPPLPEQRSTLKTCLVGCLIVCALGTVVAVGAGFWFYRNFNRVVGGYAGQALDAVIDQSQLPVDQKEAIKREIRRVTTAYQDGRLTTTDLSQGLEKLAKSPIMQTMVVSGIREGYLNRSGLSPEERAEAERSVQRVVRGVIEKKISNENLQDLIKLVSEERSPDRFELKQQLTDEELRTFLEACDRTADAAEIPDEEFQVDLVNEVRKLVDEVLAGDATP